MKRIYTLLFVCLTAMAVQAQEASDDYVPFVARYKLWHVLGFCVGPYHSEEDYYFNAYDDKEGVNINGKTYLNLYSHDGDRVVSEGLFREEDRRVYLYDKETEKEYCVYDFTLEVGDTFDIGIGEEADRCVVTKVGHLEVKDRKLKTITFSSVDSIDGFDLLHENHTWVEGIGNKGKPNEGWIPNTYCSSWSHSLAYVSSEEEYYFPFSFRNMWGNNNFVMGQELTGDDMHSSLYNGMDYEIIDGKLHVWGYLCLQPCSNNYIYCKLSPKSRRTYTVSIEHETAPPIPTCISTPHAVDVYFKLPYPEFSDYDFVYVDEEGEHPIVNWNAPLPFVEEGKEWKVGLFQDGGTHASEVEFYRMEADTIVGGKACKQWIVQSMDRTNRRTEYIGAVYEEEGRVYEYLPGREDSVLLYDFASPVGSRVDVYDAYDETIVPCLIAEKEAEESDGNLLRHTIVWGHPTASDKQRTTIWTEGIGNNKRPNYNSYDNLNDDYHWLMSCTTGNDTLYYNSRFDESISPYWCNIDKMYKTGNETRKEQLDFTHVIKTRPTVPDTRASISLLHGEYDEAVVYIGFKGMDGIYNISIRDDKDGEHFATTLETNNLQSLDISLKDYPDGQYTVTVENDEELYTASFSLPWQGNGIEPVQNSKIKNQDRADATYDLSGRRRGQGQKGVGIQKGKKYIIN